MLHLKYTPLESVATVPNVLLNSYTKAKVVVYWAYVLYLWQCESLSVMLVNAFNITLLLINVYYR